MAEKQEGRKWSAEAGAISDARDLGPKLSEKDDNAQIAASLKRSAEHSKRCKANPFRSAMSMLSFFINRASRNPPASRKRIFESPSTSCATTSIADEEAKPATAMARARMVEQQLARRGIVDPAVLAAMREVPREEFVPSGQRKFAYEDSPLSIEAGQTISQPYIVARMIEAVSLAATDCVLEIGAGSGYAAAVMSRIAAQVHAIERHEELTDLARERLRRLGYHNVTLRTGDGTRGWADSAPFNAILCAAAGPSIPRVLKEQLGIGGRLVMPVGTQREQRLVKVTRLEAHHFEEEDLGRVLFVPLIGEYGWERDDRRTESPTAAPGWNVPP